MGKPAKAKRGIPSKVEDFNAWYPFIVEALNLLTSDIRSKAWMFGAPMVGKQCVKSMR